MIIVCLLKDNSAEWQIFGSCCRTFLMILRIEKWVYSSDLLQRDVILCLCAFLGFFFILLWGQGTAEHLFEVALDDHSVLLCPV